MIKYYLVTDEFANTWNGYKNGVNIFNSFKIVGEDMWYVSISTKKEFPEIDFSEFEIVDFDDSKLGVELNYTLGWEITEEE